MTFLRVKIPMSRHSKEGKLQHHDVIERCIFLLFNQRHDVTKSLTKGFNKDFSKYRKLLDETPHVPKPAICFQSYLFVIASASEPKNTIKHTT